MMGKVRRSIILLVGLSLCTPVLMAQPSETGAMGGRPEPVDSGRIEREVDVDEVVVTATRTMRPLKEIPVITQVVTRKDIERITPRSAVDVLEMVVPGVQTMRHGQLDKMTIQGLSSDYYLIMIDGVPLSTDDGAVDLNRIDPNSIERVEIIQGASSALYGSSAIGAVINFITRKGMKPYEATVKGMYDTRGTYTYNGFASFRYKGFRSTTSGGGTFEPDYKLKIPGFNTIQKKYWKNGELHEKDTIVWGYNNYSVPGAINWNVRQALGYESGDGRFKADARGGYSHRTQHRNEKEEFLYGTLTFGSGILYRLSDNYDLDFSYNLENYVRDLHFRQAKKDAIDHVFSFRTHNGRLQFNARPFGSKGPVFNVGYQTLEEGLRSARLGSGGRRYNASTNTLYAQGDIDLIPSVRMTVGGRVDFHSRYGAHVTPRAALLWKLGMVQMRLSYAEGFRSPSPKELYMFWDHVGMFTIKGNEDLKPERSRMIIFAPELNWGSLNVTLQGYYNVVSSRITQRYEDGGKVLRYVNSSDETKLAGGSAMLRWRIVKGLRASLNYSYTWDYEEGRDVNGRRVNLSSTRPHSLTGGLSYRYAYGQWSSSIDLVGRYSSGFRAGVFDNKLKGYTPRWFASYGIMRASITQNWREYISLTLGCENLLDYKPNQLDISTSLSPGRSFYLALSLSI